MGKRSRPLIPAGSLRQRPLGSWELRVYAGVDARTGRVRHRTRTVRGSKSDAALALKELVAVVRSGPAVGADAPFARLLERVDECRLQVSGSYR